MKSLEVSALRATELRVKTVPRVFYRDFLVKRKINTACVSEHPKPGPTLRALPWERGDGGLCMRSDDGNREDVASWGRRGGQEPLGTEMRGPAAQGRVQALTPPPGAACSLLSLSQAASRSNCLAEDGPSLPQPPRAPSPWPCWGVCAPQQTGTAFPPSRGLAALSPSGLQWVAEGHVVGATGWWWSPQEMPRPRG